MNDDTTRPEKLAARRIPNARHCGSYRGGHEVHWIQARKSAEAGPGRSAHVTAVHDDGTITFADGSTLWNHEPKRLRLILDRYGKGVLLGAYSVLRVPHPGGASCFCVTGEASPCPKERAATVGSVSDLVDQLAERGGFSLSGPAALKLLERDDPAGGEGLRDDR